MDINTIFSIEKVFDTSFIIYYLFAISDIWLDIDWVKYMIALYSVSLCWVRPKIVAKIESDRNGEDDYLYDIQTT